MSARGLATVCPVREEIGWLEDLPADADLRYSTLIRLLDRINATGMNGSSRLACLNTLLPVAMDLATEKSGRQMPTALPLPAAYIAEIRTAEKAFMAMACAYENILALDEASASANSADLSPQEQAAAHYCALRCLAEALCLNFSTYRRPEEGTWRRVHKIFHSALRRRIHMIGILDCPFADVTGSVSHEYRRILLLGLSDPYELPFSTLNRVFHSLHEWSEHAHVHTEPGADPAKEMFLIDPNLDVPAMPLRQKPPSTVPHWLLDTHDLIKFLERQARILARNTHQQKDPGHKVFKTLQTIATLQRHWRGFVPREYSRNHVPHEYQLLVGLRSVDFGLNGFSDASAPGRREENIVITTHGLHGSFGAQQWLFEHRFAAPHQCQSIDQHTEGMQLLIAPRSEVALHIGELLAVKRLGQWEDWRIGVLRWAKQRDDGEMAIGVYLLGYQATPCRIQAANPSLDEPQMDDDLPAVVLYLSHPPGKGQSLVTAPGFYERQNRLWLRTSGGLEVRTMGKLLLSTSSFDWFEIRH